MKKLLRGLAVLAILVIIAAGALVLYIDRLAKVAIEKSGTYALGVPTTVENADVGIFSGQFDMRGLNVANPQGFTTAHLMRLDDGGVAVTLGSLRRDVVELPRLNLSGLDMHLERRAGKANYGVVMENLKRFENADAPPKETGSEKRFLVKEVRIENVVVHLDLLPEGGDLTRIDVPIADIRLQNVGTDSDKGVLLAELAGILIKAVIAAAVEKGGGLIPPDMLGDLQGRLAQLESLESIGVAMQARLESELKGKLDEITKSADPSKAIDDAVKKAEDQIGDALGDLLGGGKKKNGG